MNDPISDMLTRIRNANRALLPWVELPHSGEPDRPSASAIARSMAPPPDDSLATS